MSKSTSTPEKVVIDGILAEVAQERFAQIERWGQQDHPSIASEADRRNCQKAADNWKAINEARVELGTLTWDGILLEEVFEALAEEDDDLRREELVQVAAVALAEIEAIDRRAHDTEIPFDKQDEIREGAEQEIAEALDEAGE